LFDWYATYRPLVAFIVVIIDILLVSCLVLVLAVVVVMIIAYMCVGFACLLVVHVQQSIWCVRVCACTVD